MKKAPWPGFGWLAQLSVAGQLYAAFGLVLVMTSLIGAVALVGFARVNDQAESLAGKWLQGVGHLSSVRALLVDSRELEIKHSRTDDKSYHTEYEAKIAEANQAIAAALTLYRQSAAEAREQALRTKLQKNLGAYAQAQQQVISLGREKKQQDAADISDGIASMSFDEAAGTLAELTKLSFDGGLQAARHADEVYRQARGGMVALMGFTLALVVSLAWLISWRLRRQLGGEPRLATEIARAVSEGDLSTRIHLAPGDSTSLMACLSAMQKDLTASVSQVRQGSESLAAASNQIAQSNQELASRTDEQANALQQTTSTMAQLGETVRANAEHARQANELALGASQVAVQGGEVVGRVVGTMSGINESSRKIADIISVIDGIAFQTNILALNAAVEAARAGEQGRGFAVVASEVRGLAQRSADAAKEIKALISDSVDRVNDGTALVDQAGQTMNEIVKAIRRVTDIVGEISAASVEQSAAVARVGESVAQVDGATQQNAALVEQGAAAADSLRQQADQLVQAVAVFRLAPH